MKIIDGPLDKTTMCGHLFCEKNTGYYYACILPVNHSQRVAKIIGTGCGGVPEIVEEPTKHEFGLIKDPT